jgi:SHS2 domain-containing protein
MFIIWACRPAACAAAIQWRARHEVEGRPLIASELPASGEGLVPRTHPGFYLIDHPADLGIEAQGETLAQAFEQAATGLMSVILDLSSVEALVSREVILEASDLEHLLVKWLAEVLYLYDGEKFVSKEFSVSELRQGSLRATLRGETFAAEKHVTRLDVKAVTYHQLLVEESNEVCRVRVFLDI